MGWVLIMLASKRLLKHIFLDHWVAFSDPDSAFNSAFVFWSSHIKPKILYDFGRNFVENREISLKIINFGRNFVENHEFWTDFASTRPDGSDVMFLQSTGAFLLTQTRPFYLWINKKPRSQICSFLLAFRVNSTFLFAFRLHFGQKIDLFVIDS